MLQTDFLGAPTLLWLIFGSSLFLMLAMDLWGHRGRVAESFGSAMAWSVVWIVLGLAFSGVVWRWLGPYEAQNYLAAYLIEKSLSVDNLFVFLLIFRSLKIPQAYQRRVLSWGIVGALVFRAIFVVLGSAAMERFHWVAYIFGGILILAAIRAVWEDPSDDEESRIVEWFRRHLRVASSLGGGSFFVREDGRLRPTRLVLAVCALEVTDVVFAVDSVPAAFSVAKTPFVVYSSNAFAILGLRALYVVLAGVLSELKYLHYGLAGVLAFAGLKMCLTEVIHIHPLLSVGIIVAMISASVLPSVIQRRNADPPQAS